MRLQGEVSFDSPVISCVFHGTLLGLLIFIILMCDINSGITHSSMISFALVMSRLDYGAQLWSRYLINMNEKTQDISGMQGMSYPERLTVLKLYFLYLSMENFGVPSFKLFPNIRTRISDRRRRACITSHVSLGDWEH